MRGLAFFLVFMAALPFAFVSPFNGVLLWYCFSLGNFHRLTWGFFSDLNYAYVVAIVTCLSWIFSRTERSRLPLTPLTVMTVLFMAWMTVTSFTATAPAADVWDKWSTVEKVLFMALVGYALTTTRDRMIGLSGSSSGRSACGASKERSGASCMVAGPIFGGLMGQQSGIITISASR